jgi:hypothetical protein
MLLTQTLLAFQLLHCCYTASAHPLSISKKLPKMDVNLKIAEDSHHPATITRRSMTRGNIDDNLSFHDLITDLFEKDSKQDPIEERHSNQGNQFLLIFIFLRADGSINRDV